MNRHLHFPSAACPFQVRIAVRRPELVKAFELVYRSYLDRGYIEPHPGSIVYREAFGLPVSRTIVAVSQADAIVGTVTVVGDNPLGLELEATYPSEVQSLRDEGRNLAEITCLAIRASDESRPTEVFFELTRFMIHYAYWREYDDLLMAVHPRHHRFYWRRFRVWPLGPCRPHSSVRDNPSIGCRIDLHTLKQNVTPEVLHQYFGEELPKAAHMAPPIDRADHDYFLTRSGITPRVEPTEHRQRHKDAA